MLAAEQHVVVLSRGRFRRIVLSLGSIYIFGFVSAIA